MANSRIVKKEVQSCKHCDFRFDKNLAKCPNCRKWNTPLFNPNAQLDNGTDADETVLLSKVSDSPFQYIKNTGPWDPCFSLAGGIVTISTTLIGGAPGAGKSTMALQLCDQIANVTRREILYIAAEEAKEQIKERAQRLKLKSLDLIRVYPMGASTDLGHILTARKPAAMVVDSLPGLTTDMDQAVELCKRFKEYSVALNAPTLIIDHITKDHEFAGLMALQHEVDITMQLTVHDEVMRELSTIKSRMGPAVSVPLEMTGEGLFLGDEEEDDDDK